MYIKQKPKVRCMQSSASATNPFDSKGRYTPDDYLSFGEKALLALEQGMDMGITITPEYDEDDLPDNQVDILSSFRHDAVDIVEMFGHMPDSSDSRPIFAPIEESNESQSN